MTTVSKVWACPISTCTHIPLVSDAPELYRVVRSLSTMWEMSSFGQGLLSDAEATQPVRERAEPKSIGVEPSVYTLISAIDHQLPELPVFTTRMKRAVRAANDATSIGPPALSVATVAQLTPSAETWISALGA